MCITEQRKGKTWCCISTAVTLTKCNSHIEHAFNHIFVHTLTLIYELSPIFYLFQVLPSGVKNDLGVNLDLVKAIDDPTTFFNDGVRKIDFVLVYEESPKDTLDFPEDIVDTTMAMGGEFDNISK